MPSEISNKWIPLSQLSLGTPYSAEYLSLLARKGKLKARKFDNVWYSTKLILDEYVAKHNSKPAKTNDPDELVPLSQLSAGTPYSTEYLSLLARKHKLTARKFDNVWYATKRDIDAYIRKQDAKVTTSPVSIPEKKLFLHDVRRKGETLLLKAPEVKGLAPRSYSAHTALIAEVLRPAPAHRLSRVILPLTAALSLIVAMGAGFSVLRHTSPLTARGLEGRAVALAGSPEVASILEAFRALFGISPASDRTPIAFPRGTAPAPLAITDVTPSLDPSALKSELQASLESYVRTQLSGLASPAPRIIYQTTSPTINTTVIREEILLADTRPTVTRQSSSDVDLFSRVVGRLTDGGSFTNPTISGGSISGASISGGTISGASITSPLIDLTNLSFVNATGTNATTTNLYASNTITGPASFTVNSSGNVGIGTTSPSYKFSVAGSGFFDGGTIYASSLIATSSLTTPLLSTTNLLIAGSTTLQNLTFQNATGTNATTTNLYVSGRASTTELRANTAYFGNVGIGTTSPEKKLDVALGSEAGEGIRVSNFSGHFAGLGVDANASLYGASLFVDGTKRFTVESNGGAILGSTYLASNDAPTNGLIVEGNVGIGTTNPSTKLEVAGGFLVTGSTTLQALSSVNSTTTNATTTNLYVSGRASTTELRANTAYFGGNVGIGTTNPETNLDIGSAGPAQASLTLRSTGTGGNRIGAWLRLQQHNSNSAFWNFDTGGAGGNNFYIYSDGLSATPQLFLDPATSRVAINTTSFSGSPTGTRFAVANQDGVGDDSVYISVRSPNTTSDAAYHSVDGTNVVYSGLMAGSACGAGNWAVYASGCRLMVTQTGNTGIGTTTPSYKLSVSGSAFFDGGTIYTSSLVATSSLTTASFLTTNATTTNATTTNLYVSGLASTTDLRANTALFGGRVGIGSTTPSTLFTVAGTSTLQDILPGGTMTNNASIYDIGSSTARWNSVWAKTLNVGTSTWSLNNGSDGRLSFWSAANGGGTETLSLASGGNVGIGTTNPSSKLHVRTATDQNLWVRSSADAGTGIGFASLNDTGAAFAEMEFKASKFWFTGGGNVGIGTTTPNNKLAVIDNSGSAQMSFGRSGTSYTNLYTGTANDFYLQPGGTTVLTALSSGNIGIGTTTPSMRLSVQGAADGTNGLKIFGSSGVDIAQFGAAGSGSSAQRGFFALTDNGTRTVAIAANSSDSATYFNAGNVGIGTTNPSFRADIRNTLTGTADATDPVLFLMNTTNSGTTKIRMTDGATSNGYITFTANASAASQLLGFGSNAVQQMVINGSGNVGIGTTNPAVKLDVSGEVRSRGGAFSLHDGTTLGGGLYFHKVITGAGTDLSPALFAEGAAGDLHFMTGGSATTKMFINQDGNVGIGTTNPGSLLHLVGNSVDSPIIKITGASAQDIAVFGDESSATSNIGFLRLYNAGTVMINLSATNATYFNAGNVGIGTTNPGTNRLQVDGVTLVNTAGSASAPAIQLPTGGTNGGFYTDGGGGIFGADNGANIFEFGLYNANPAIKIQSRAAGTSQPGSYLEVGRNSSGNGAPGIVNLLDKSGNSHAIWSDTSNVLRINTSFPTEDAGDTGGTIVGTQTSSLDSKNITAEFTDNAEALSTILGTPLYNFTYKSGALNNQEFTGIITDYSPVFGMDRDAAHPGGKSFNPVSAFGYTVAAFKQLYAELEEVIEVAGTFRENLVAWMGDAANGIGDFFAERVRTKELCVSDESGETCITRDQLDLLLASAGTTSSGSSGGSVIGEVEIISPEEPAPTTESTSSPEVGSEQATSTPDMIAGGDSASTTPETVTDEPATEAPATVETPVSEAETVVEPAPEAPAQETAVGETAPAPESPIS